MDQARSFGKLIAAARHWAKSRARLRQLADSKRATKGDIQKAQRANSAAARKLELAVRQFDESVSNMQLSLPGSKKRKGVNIDWAKAAGVVAKVAGGVEQALGTPKTPFISPGEVQVIDVDGKEVE